MRYNRKKKIILCPKVLNLYSIADYDRSLQFIQEIENCNMCNDGEEIVISFAYCKVLKAAAQVVLFAKVEMLLEQSNVKVTVRLSNKSKEVNEHLRKSGFLSLCKHRKAENKIEPSPLLMISSQDKQLIDEITDFVINQAYGENYTPEQEELIGTAISEAHYNVILHAYKYLDVTKRWWLRCSIIDGELYLIIYDNGIGFARSFDESNENFSKNDWVAILQEYINNLGIQEDVSHFSQSEAFSYFQNQQSQLIYIAMTENETGQTGSAASGHGRGSKRIKALVNENKNGHLWVFSHRGQYVYADDKSLPQMHDHSRSLNGTLIQWNIKL